MSKKIPLTIYLSKDGITLSECFDFEDKKKPEQFSMHIDGFEESVGYIDISKPKDPPWLDFFRKATGEGNVKKLESIVRKTQSLSAIVAVKHVKSSRYFIICFGYGKKFLNEDCYERFFGRNLVLNTADEKKVIALRTRSFEGVPWYKEYQSFISNKLSDFDFNCDYELLQKITADYEDRLPPEFIVKVPLKSNPQKTVEKNLVSFKIAGHSSIKINTNITDLKVIDLFNWLEENFNKTRYKDLVKNIESFEPISDSSGISVLNDLLVEKIIKKEFEGFHLIIPEKVEPEDLSSFQISKTTFFGDDRLDTLDIDILFDFFEKEGRLENLTFHELREIKVMGYKADDHQHTWSLSRCLFGELEYCDEKFTLIDGQWFSVESNFHAQMISKVTGCLSNSDIFLPFDKKEHIDEKNYNEAIAKDQGFLLFDRDLVKPSVKGEIEACDLLDKTNLIHVKRYRSSACLSHLFFQSYVSHQLLLDDQIFLENFVEKIRVKDPIIADEFRDGISTRAYSISLVIILENKKDPDWVGTAKDLPIFSLITLSKTIDLLKSRGNNISVNIHLVGAV